MVCCVHAWRCVVSVLGWCVGSDLDVAFVLGLAERRKGSFLVGCHGRVVQLVLRIVLSHRVYELSELVATV